MSHIKWILNIKDQSSPIMLSVHDTHADAFTEAIRCQSSNFEITIATDMTLKNNPMQERGWGLNNEQLSKRLIEIIHKLSINLRRVRKD